MQAMVDACAWKTGLWAAATASAAVDSERSLSALVGRGSDRTVSALGVCTSADAEAFLWYLLEALIVASLRTTCANAACGAPAQQLPEELQPPPGTLDGGPESSWGGNELPWGSSASAALGGGGSAIDGSRRQQGFAAALVLNKVDLVEQEAWLDRVTRTLTTVAGGNPHRVRMQV